MKKVLIPILLILIGILISIIIINSKGYSWQYTKNNDIIELTTNKSTVLNKNVVGSDSVHEWRFKVIKRGNVKLTFKYYRTWEGEGKTAKTNQYNVKVN